MMMREKLPVMMCIREIINKLKIDGDAWYLITSRVIWRDRGKTIATRIGGWTVISFLAIDCCLIYVEVQQTRDRDLAFYETIVATCCRICFSPQSSYILARSITTRDRRKSVMSIFTMFIQH